MEKKRCSRCGIVKPVSEFGKDASRKDGLNVWCKSCKRECDRQYYKSHAGEIANKKHQYWADNVEEIAAYRHQWWIDNPDKARAYLARRRAMLRGAPGWDYTTAAMIAARWEMWGNLCYICGEPATATDHVKPLSKGGAHFPCNLRPICDHCNSVKGNKWPDIPPASVWRLLAIDVQVDLHSADLDRAARGGNNLGLAGLRRVGLDVLKLALNHKFRSLDATLYVAFRLDFRGHCNTPSAAYTGGPSLAVG